MNARDTLTIAAARLATSAHQEWQEFVSAFADYATEKKDECIRAPVTEVQVAQGRAQVCSQLDDLLRNAVTSANRIELLAEKRK